jgi:hypothetical protein
MGTSLQYDAIAIFARDRIRLFLDAGSVNKARWIYLLVTNDISDRRMSSRPDGLEPVEFALPVQDGRGRQRDGRCC